MLPAKASLHHRAINPALLLVYTYGSASKEHEGGAGVREKGEFTYQAFRKYLLGCYWNPKSKLCSVYDRKIGLWTLWSNPCHPFC